MEYLALREISRSNKRLHTMIEIILQTGLRIGELARLKTKHLKLAETKGELHIEPYSTIPHRVIPLNGRAHQLLKLYITELDSTPEDHPLFPTREGNHIIIRNIRSSIDRAMAKAGIENACVNDLRNTFIVHQLRSGVAIDVVASTVGHRSKTTTQKYLELLDEPYSPNGESKLVDI
jgi:integrase/recombinase XerC/integrase/recombinase XerD